MLFRTETMCITYHLWALGLVQEKALTISLGLKGQVLLVRVLEGEG